MSAARPQVGRRDGDAIETLVMDCIEAGVVLGLDDGRLSVKAPRDSDMGPLVAKLRSRREELVGYLEHDAARRRLLSMGPIRHPDNDSVLSNGQERLWFMFQYEDDPTTYNMFGAYRVLGDFSYQALDAALQAIMFRHQVFRSYIESYDGELIQKFAPVSRVHIPVDDFSSLALDEREAAVTDWLEAESETVFDLSSYPLWRFRLVKVDEHEHIFAFSVHHIVCDGLSELVLLGELDHWYAAFLADPETEVPELKTRYCDYAAWQRAYLGSMRYLEDLAWWRTALAGAPPRLEVPLDKPRPPLGSNAGDWVNFFVEAETTEELWAVGRRVGTTTFMVGLTLWGLLIRDFSGQDDLVVGTPVSNRNHPDLEPLVGFFVNSVPLRLRFDPTATFAEAVSAVSAASLAAFDRQRVPFEHLVEELGVRREPSYNPIFQTMFAMEDAPDDDDDDDEVANLVLKPLEVTEATSMFDLDLLLTGMPDGRLEGGLNYNSDLYHRATIERMVAHFLALCRSVASDPDMTLADLRAVGVEDDANVAVGQGLLVDYEIDTTIAARFETVALARPQVVAVAHNERSTTYGQLLAWSATVAEHLANLGVEAGDVVAVEVGRGIPYVATILGVLRRGAAFLPIDPDYPAGRRQYMVGDAAASVLVTEKPLDGEPSVVAVVDDTELFLTSRAEGRPLDPPLPGGSPIAYVIYTSGSTGRPKGAMVRHDGALNHIDAEVDVLDLADDFVFLQTAPSSSDISVWQFLGPLLYGGRTVVVDTHTQLDPAALLATARSSKASIIELVPSVLQLLCDHAQALPPEERAMPDLRRMLITGEAAPVPVVNAWLGLYPQVPVVNAYGPTEAADDVCQAEITEPLAPDARNVPIGRPINNMSIHLLDPDRRPVPLGASGEICIAGVGVGAGYVGSPEKTAAAFVDNPFATGEHDRHLYRTGDLGRWRTDGRLEFLGRADEQVKVRGFRLELGEITACVLADDRVREAATILTTGDTGEPLLVAYYSMVDGAELDAADLRSHLKGMLPVQIIPNLLIPLDALPHLPNGKIDTKSLPRPESTLSLDDDEREPTATEAEVRAIWCDLLGVPSLALDADFFDWGGHSLLAVRMLAQVRERFNKEVSVARFFAEPSLSAFCRLLDVTAETVDTVELVAAGKSRYPLSPGQARLWFLNLFESDHSTYNMPSALKFTGRLDYQAFCRAVTRLAERHPSMRTRIDVENGRPYQEIMPPSPVQIPTTDLRSLGAEELEVAVRDRIDALLDHEFELDRAPLWHFELLEAGEEESYLLTTVHHIITDGISNELLIGELVGFYAAEIFELDEEPFPPIAFNYGDYAEWQLALQDTNRLRRQQLYWERTLEGAPALLDLPTDRPRPATQTYNGAAYEFELDPALVERLRAYAREQSATLFMVFQAGMAALLRAYSGQNDIVVGTPIGGRSRAELEPIVGFFVNTLALRTIVDPDAGFDALLAQVRAKAIEAFDHCDVPFEQIVERTTAERNPSFSPIFQVMVAFEEDSSDGDDLAGIDIEPLAFSEKTAMFDLDVLFDDDGADGVSCSITYNVDLFDRDTVVRMGRHLERLLRAVVTDPGVPVGDIGLMSTDDRAELVSLERGPEPTWDNDRTITSLIAQAALDHPDRSAVVDDERALSYAQFVGRARWLAGELIANGVGPGRFVALVDDRSVDFAVAVVAVLWSGAAYVPVDPAYPADRVRHMLADSAAEVVITSQARLDTLLPALVEGGIDRTVVVVPPVSNRSAPTHPDGTTVPVVVSSDAESAAPVGTTIVQLDDPGPDVNRGPLEPMAVDPGAPAYLLYTSGSTGRPKGVLIPHRGQLNHILAEADLLDLDHTLVMGQSAPSSSDISVWQFLAPLALGGTCAVVSTEEVLHAELLLARIERDGINLVEFVPAVFDHLLAYLDELDDAAAERAIAVLQRIDAAMITGEAAPVATVDRWLSTVPGVPIVNAYGPTEASDDVCQQWIDTPLGHNVRSVPIGKPLPGLTVSIRDAELRRVPRGVRGEIVIGGVGVGDGYWRRPETTAEVFVPDTIDPTGSNMLYRTGDIGRWTSDGVIEYLGRLDQQVNLLGMRIELGEIESALTAQPGVREAAVIVTDERPRRLVAFWAGDRSDARSHDNGPDTELADQLRVLLPAHMIPQGWVRLHALPRTPMGKVDRRRLPIGAAEAAFEAQAYVAPESDAEVTMTDVWAEVLDMEQVSVNADFFELGGNSLLAVQAVRRIYECFDVEVPLVEFFRDSTVSGLLVTIDRIRADAAAKDASLGEVEL